MEKLIVLLAVLALLFGCSETEIERNSYSGTVTDKHCEQKGTINSYIVIEKEIFRIGTVHCDTLSKGSKVKAQYNRSLYITDIEYVNK